MYREHKRLPSKNWLLTTKIYLSGLFRITNAAITPGTQPQSHNKKTITIDPQPLPITDSGGKKMASKTLQILI